MSKQEEINQIAMKMGQICDEHSKRAYRSAYHMPTKVIPENLLRTLVKTRTGITDFRIKDNEYKITDWKSVKRVIDYDLSDKESWVREHRDCDNHAYHFAARFAFVYGINCVGVVRCLVDFGGDGDWGYHYANLIVAMNQRGQVADVYLYEPLNDKHKKITSSPDVVRMGDDYYKLNSFADFI